MNSKVCSKCGEEKPMEDFYADCSAKKGYKSACKECIKKAMAECTKKAMAENKKTDSANLYAKIKRGRNKLEQEGAGEITLEIYDYFSSMGHPFTFKEMKSIMPEIIEASRNNKVLTKITEIEQRYGLSSDDYIVDMKKELQEDRKLANVFKTDWGSGATRPINQLTLDGELIRTFPSIKEASAHVGAEYTSNIHLCVTGVGQSAHGYIWEYADC